MKSFHKPKILYFKVFLVYLLYLPFTSKSQCTAAGGPFIQTIVTNTVWNTNMSIHTQVRVYAGYTLSIVASSANTTIDFDPGTEIFVEVGAILAITGSNGYTVTLTSSSQDWVGITVDGTAGQDQTGVPPTNQGLCSMDNAVISYACIGVLVKGGGILYALNSQFDTYYTEAVKMEPYLEPGGGDNLSHFTDCTFINTTSNVTVYLDEVARINFRGCTFTDNSTTWAKIGIYSDQSTFNITPEYSTGVNGSGCREWAGPRSSFTNFYYAIQATNSFINCNTLETDIINTDFTDNQYGIYFGNASSSDHFVFINGCTFINDFGVPGFFSPEYDIHFYGGQVMFVIDNNTFHIETDHAKMIFIEGQSAGDRTHIIRKNTFQNDAFTTTTAASYGIHYQNAYPTALLLIECNDFTTGQNNYDIYFNDPQENQLNNDGSDANNSFSQTPSPLSDINIQSPNGLTYYRTNGTPAYVATTNINQQGGGTNHCSIECNPDIGQLGRRMPRKPQTNDYYLAGPIKIVGNNMNETSEFVLKVYDLDNNLLLVDRNVKLEFNLNPDQLSERYFYVYTIVNSNGEIIKRGKIMRQ